MLRTEATARLPAWVSEQSVRYLEHIEAGRTIRGLARDQDCHPSTILRQIRRVETRRDDPLVDEVLKSLGRLVVNAPVVRPITASVAYRRSSNMSFQTYSSASNTNDVPSDSELAREAPRILRRLCENGAVLALAADLEKGVVVRDGPDGSSARTAVVDRSVAQAMALNEWISGEVAGRISRYTITQAGRHALNKMIAKEENSRVARMDAISCPPEEDASVLPDAAHRQTRSCNTESPLSVLARRKDRNGLPFLDETLVSAGERLREDFELAQVGSGAGQNWDRLLTGGVRTSGSSGIPQIGQSAAQDRVLMALQDLGPGLSDVALRCCCFLEGLETAEKRLGWSARSGKIVLRIALQRLKCHYATQSEDAHMIG